jgi:hypothetical protein
MNLVRILLLTFFFGSDCGAEYQNASMQVKIVRESMNRMIEAWKEIPGAEEDECSSAPPPASQSQRRSSLTGEGHSLCSFSCTWLLATSSACTDLVNLFLYTLQEVKNHIRVSCCL